ncbi:MAG: bifunctional oligoribonuclease/PAP phosphatase NrnA [Eubacteriales bacterium]|nr:bifunctional oligoribonuclease/PAP phosphatase NrnA [Eubacteriales bacterium]NCC81506.1 bifunctional oligoribonuclease/PAP phosphatase NrnA [Clostridia bacterium]
MKKIAEIIKHAEKISVISHKDPDGDAVGSQLGLALALEKEGKEVYSYNVGEVPEYLFFLPGSGTVKIYNGEDLSDSLVIFVDCADRNRPGIQLPEGITINIDHHVSNDNFAMYNYIDTKSASTGEIIYKLIREMGIELDKNIATCLYTAVSTDTGSFMYSNTTADTHLIAADLINNGADTDGLRENFFEGVSLKRFKLTKYAYQEVNFACDNLLAWIKIPYSFIREIGAKEEETEGVVGHIRNIKDVEVALLLKEREDGKIKGSLRSKKMIDVSKIAEIFGGGGHKRAAGFELSGTLEEAEEIIISELKKELKNV